MTPRPPAVRIDDLAAPLFPPDVVAMREAMAQMGEGLRLEEEVLLADACAQTGLDDFAIVERIYALAGQPLTADARRAMDEFMRQHPRSKYGGVVYDFAQPGLDPAERRAALRFYVDRFGVEIER